MSTFDELLAKVLARDPSYGRDAYVFVQESLDHAIELRDRERQAPGTPLPATAIEVLPDDAEEAADAPGEHIGGVQLCEAFRDLAVERFGLLAREVLESWGLRGTRDIGNVVFNLIDAELMRANDDDCVEDFDAVFAFDEAFSKEMDLIP